MIGCKTDLPLISKPNRIDQRQVFIEPIVLQGGLGDCWFLAAIASVAEQKPEVIQRIFKTQKYNKAGHYELEIMARGIWTTVVVTDRLPPTSKASRPGREEAIGRVKSEGPLWVALLEKAYAQEYGGYHNLQGGFTGFATGDLTGIPAVATVNLNSSRWCLFKGGIIRFKNAYWSETIPVAQYPVSPARTPSPSPLRCKDGV